MGLSSTLDSARFSPFHRKLVVGCMGGPLLDGYMLSIIGIAMVGLTAQFGANELEVSLIGASALVGIFFGALFLGPVDGQNRPPPDVHH